MDRSAAMRRVQPPVEAGTIVGDSTVDRTGAELSAGPWSNIAGATSPAQVEGNVRATGWALSREDMDEIDRLTAGSD
jgi:aryl-alcohol dehydrogenase-like predicted oxidoreductase